MAEDDAARRTNDFRDYWHHRTPAPRATAIPRGLAARDFGAADLPELCQMRIDLVEVSALMPHRAVKIRVMFAVLDQAIAEIEAGSTTENRMAELMAQTRRARRAA